MPGKDTRVVEMQFQNKDFEKNIATSQKSLNRFKKDLNFDDTSKGLEKFGKSMDSLKFDKFFDNIQRLTDKFTGIGDIGEFMISKIRHSLEEAANSAIRFSKSLTFDQVDAGKEKFEQLNKSIQTIKAATGKTEEEVQGVLKRLNDYTDMTSYSFSDMASNIGKFTSVGIPLEQAEKQMEGIANWAARSGAGIQEASRAMYNLSQAMGVGSLKLMDWKSIENAGMATKEFKQQLIEAGLAAGTLVAETKKDANGVEQIVYKTSKKLGKQVEVNFQNMSQTLSKGWANTTAIGNALLGYYYEDLKFENEEGMKDLTDDQKKMFDEMFKQYGKIDDKSWKKLSDQGLGSDDLKQSLLDTAEAMGALTAEVNADGKKIYTTTDKTGKKIEFTLDTFEKGLGGGWLTRSIAKTVYSFDDLAKGSYDAAMKCLSFTDVLNAWKDMISTGWMASIQHIFGGLSDSIEVFTAMCDKAGEMLGNIFGVNGAINKILGLWDNKENRDTLWGMIIGEYGEGEDVLYKNAYGLLDIIKDIGGIISGAFWDLMKDIAEPFYGGDKLAEWETDTEVRYQFLADRLQVFVDRVRYAILKVKDFFQEIPEGASKSRWETIKDIVGAVFRVVSIAVQTISGIFTFFGKIKKQLEPSIIAISDLITSLAGGITGAEKDLRKSHGIQTFFSNFADALVPVTNFINKVVAGLAKLIKGFFEWGIEGGNFIKIWETIKSVFKGIINIFGKISGPILDFFKEIGPAIGDFFTKGLNKDTLKNFGKTLGKSLGNLINTLVNYIPGLWSKIKNFFSSIFNTAKDVLGTEEPGILNSIINFIKGVFGGVWEFLKNLGNRLSDENSLASLILRLLGTGIGFVADLLGKIRDSISGISLYDVVIMITGGFILFTAFSLIKSALNVIRGISEIIGGFGEILDAIAYRIRGVDGSEKFLRVSQGIALIALAVVVLGQMQWQEALQGVIAIGAIGGIVILLTKVMTKMLEKVKFSSTIKMAIALASLSAGLLIFSAGVFVLVRALKPLANTNWEGLAKMGAGLAGILYLFSLFSFVSKLAKVSFKSMAGLGILAIGIGILVDSLKPLAEVNWAQMAKMGAGLAAILLMFAGFSRIMGSIKDKGISQTAFLAIGIAILVQALLPLASMDWSQMSHMGVGLLAILVLLAGFSHIAGSLKSKGMFSTITLAAGIVILMEAIKPLADYNWEKLGKMGAGLLVVLFFLAEFTKISGSLKGKSMKSTIALALGIILLMEAIKPLAEYSWEKLGKMFAGLTLTLLELAEFTKLMVSIKDKGMSKIILLAAGIWILMETIKPLTDIDWEDLGKMFAGLGVVLFELVEFSKHMASIKNKGLGNTILLAAGIYILMEALKPLAEYNWEDIGKMGAGLAGILTILVASSKKMGQIKAKTSFGIMIFSAALYAIIYVLQPLANYKWEDLAKLGVGLLAAVVMLGIAAKAIKGIDWKSALGSFAIMLGLAVMISVFGKTVDKVKDIKSTKLLAFAASIVILSIAIRIVLSSINKLEAQTKGIEIGSKLAMIAASLVTVGLLMFELSLLIPRINSANIKKLVVFSIAVDVLMPSLIIAAAAINKLDKVRTGADVGKKLGLLAGALISVGVLLAELALFIPKINNGEVIKLVGFSIAVDLVMPSLIIAVEAINKIKVPKSGKETFEKIGLIIPALIAVAVLMGELAVLIPLINNIDGWMGLVKLEVFAIAVDTVMPALIVAAKAVNEIKVTEITNKKGNTHTSFKETFEKILSFASAIAGMAIIMAEMAFLIPLINQVDGWMGLLKLEAFAVAIRIVMPALIDTANALNSIQLPTLKQDISTTQSSRKGGSKSSIKDKGERFANTSEIGAKLLMFSAAVIGMGLIMLELAAIIPMIDKIDGIEGIAKLAAFAGAIRFVMPAIKDVADAINSITIPTLNGASSSVKGGRVKGIIKDSTSDSSNSNAGQRIPGIEEMGAKITMIAMAVLTLAGVMGLLALVIPRINGIESGINGIQKLAAFAVAIRIIMPALKDVAEAINSIKIPSVKGGSSIKDNVSLKTSKKIVKQEKGSTENADKGFGKFEELSGFIAIIGIAVLTMAAIIGVLSNVIERTNNIDGIEGIGKLAAFAGVIRLVMPALKDIAEAINSIKVPTIKGGYTSKDNVLFKNSKKTKGQVNEFEQKGDTGIAKFDELSGFIAIIGIAVLAMAAIIGVLSNVIQRTNDIDGVEGIGKLAAFAGVIRLIMPALITVAKAINSIKIPTVKNGVIDKNAVDKKTKRRTKNQRNDYTDKGERGIGAFEDLSGLVVMIGIAVVAMAGIMAELAALIPLINNIDGLEGIGKLAGFAVAVDLIMPALMIAAKAINMIKVPTMMTGSGNKQKEETIKFKQLTGFYGIIGMAIIALAAIMGEFAALIPLIDQIDESGVYKLLAFSLAIEVIMPALITVAVAINQIKLPKVNKKPATFKELTGLYALIGVAVMAMGAIMGELAALIPLINGIDGWDGIAKLGAFAIAVELIMPALKVVAEAISKIKLPKIINRPATFKELTGLYALIGLAVTTMGLMMLEFAAIIPLVDKINGWEGMAKLVLFAFAFELIIPALLTISDAINKIKIPKVNNKPATFKELTGLYAVIGIAVVTMAGIMFELAKLIPMVNGIDGIGGIGKLVAFAFSINIVVAALLTIVDAINNIELPKNGKKILAPKDLSGKFILIGMAIGTLALLMGELALLVPAINGINGFGGMVKLVVFTISLNIMMASLGTVVKAINDIKTPTSKEALKKKMLILAEVVGVVALLTAELALFIYRINDADIVRIIGFSIAVRALMPVLDSVVKAINNIQTPTSKEALTKKLWILGGSLITVAAIIAEMALFIDQINSSDFEKLLGFAAAVYLVMPSLEKVVGMINDIEAPEEGKELGFKMAILGGAFIAVAAIIAELALLSNQINNSNFESMLGIAAAVYLILPALSKVIEAIGEIEAPEEGKEVGFKLAIMAGALIAVAAIIAELALLGGMISNADVLKIMGFALAVDIIMPALIMAVYAINKIEAPESWSDVGKKIAMMVVAVIAVGGLMAVLALVIDKVQGIEPVAMLAFTAGVLVLGIAVALMVGVIGGIKQSAINNLGKKLAVIIVAVVAIGALMYIFSEMLDSTKDIDPKAMLTFSASIILLVIALAGAAAIISVLGKVDAGTIAKGSAGLVAVGTALGAVIDIIAGFAASAIDKMTSALIDIGTSLKWFDEDVSLVNSDRVRDGMSLVKDLCELAIYVADKGDLSGNIDRYSTTMARLGAGISLFNGNAGGSAGISRAKTAISDIVEMSSELSELTTISDVSSTISNIAGAIKIYIDTLEGKTLEGTPDSSKIRDVFIALNEAIPDDTMVADASAFADETKASSLNSYAIGLANISTALESFAKGTETMDFKSISTAITKLQAISDLGPLIKETVTTKVDIGGFITFEKEVVKEKESLQSFATDITSLTTALTNFGTEMGNITGESWGRIDAGIGHLQAFAKLEGSLTPLGGLVEFVVGKRDLTSFGKKIGPLGKGLKEFCDHIVGAQSLDNGEADTASDVLIKLATAASTMPPNSGIFSKFSNTNITKFADQIPSLGTGVCGYANAVRDITGLGSEKLETATKVLVAICEAASKIPANEGMITLWSNIDYDKFGDGSMTSLGKGVTNFAEAVKSAPGLSDTSLETATKVLVAICEAASLIPENSGLVTLFKGVNYSTFESDMGHMGAGLLAFARNVGGLVAQDHKLKAKDLTDGERENIQVVTSIVDSFTKLIEILSTLTDLSTDLTSASERIKKKMSEIGNDLGQAMILFLEGFFNENEASADVRRDKLDKIVNEYDTYLPAIEEFVKVLSGLSSISFINPSNIETMLTGVSTGLTSILTFDDEIPWTQKHNNIMDRVVNICDALGKMRDYIGAYESKSIEKWFGDLVNAYYMYRKAILYEGWDDRRENVTNRIIKICEGLGLISDYIHDYNSKSIEQWFVDLVDGYKAFADGINNIYADESGQFAWTEGTQTAFDRIKEMVNIIQTLDGIESPTISPVMDFNTVEQQLMQWGNKPLPGISTMLNGDISLKLDASQLEAITPKDYTVYFDSITTKMNEMNKDIVNLGTELRSMKVVMDTGAVVGAIGDGVDRHIGKNAFYETRLKN